MVKTILELYDNLCKLKSTLPFDGSVIVNGIF